MRTVRRAWLIFGLLLTCGIITFTVSVDWSTQSWLDLAAYAVSVVAIVGVLIYAIGGAPHGAVFWRAFRWVFVGVAAAQVSVHSIAAAKQHGYSAAGTAAFFTVIAIMMGWILALQWVALTRLATEE
jgi:hypothetical protein